jgi:hypothetical protein
MTSRDPQRHSLPTDLAEVAKKLCREHLIFDKVY